MTKGQGSPDRGADPGNSRLEDTAAGWPTPQAHDSKAPRSAEKVEEIRASAPGRGAAGGAPGLSNLNEKATTWPTPDTQNHRPGSARRKQSVEAEARGSRKGISLHHEVERWPTPGAGDGKKGSDPVRRDTGNPNSNLATAIDRWPTPATRDYKGANGEAHQENGSGRLHMDQLPNFVTHIWSTPSAADCTGTTGGGQARSLRTDTNQWSTPSVADVTGGRTSRSGDRKDELLLNSQAKAVDQWMTPRVAVGAYTRDKGKKGDERLTLQGQAETSPSSLPAPATAHPGSTSQDVIFAAYRRYRATTNSSLRSEMRALVMRALRVKVKRGRDKDGEKTRAVLPRTRYTRPSFRKSLNPIFVEWLMGWPIGWTSCASSATAFSQYKVRMRSALWRLDLHDAPPAQLTLFG